MNKLLYIGAPTSSECVRIIYTASATQLTIDKQPVIMGDNSLLMIPEYITYSAPETVVQIDIEDCTLHCSKMYTIQGDEYTATLISMLTKYFAMPETNHIVYSLTLAIVSYLSMNHTQYHKPIVDKIIENIESGYHNPNYSLADFIRTLPFNYDYVRKLFIAQTGVSPHHYMTSLRMSKALQLLKDNGHNMSISKISLLCGYDEPLYFSRVFKKHNGYSPMNYLKANYGSLQRTLAVELD